MSSEFSKFKEMMVAERAKKKVLQEEIEKVGQELIQIGSQYEKAIINDNDEQADELQQRLGMNERVLQRKKDKMTFLDKDFAHEEIEKQADKVLQEANQGINGLSLNAKKLAVEHQELREKLIEKTREIGENKRLEHKYINAANYAASILPGWAAKQSEYQHNTPVNRYEYGRYCSTPDLKAFPYDDLQKAKGGMRV